MESVPDPTVLHSTVTPC